MYWLDNTETDPLDSSKTTSKAITFAASVEIAITKAFDPLRIEKFFLRLEDDAKILNTSIGNGLQNNLKTIQDTIFNVYKEGLDYGFAYGDAKDYIEAIAASSNKMVSITKQNTINAIALGKAMGITAKEAGALYGSFMGAGMGQAVANQKLTEAFKLARQYGVDASTLTKTVADNVFKAAAYGFKDGVKGLTDMAIQAQRVGISMEVAEKAANKAFDPEGAIEMASSLQLLGGAAGGMGDVFGLMYDAQSDVGSLNDKIAKTTASMVDFNSKSGEFKINPAMRRDLTQYAESIGSTYDEISKVAIKTRKEQEIMSKIPLGKYSDAEKSLITSMAEIGIGGKIEIKDPTSDKMLDVSNLTNTNIAELRKFQDEANKAPIDVAKDQLSVQKLMVLRLEEIKNAGIFGTGVETGLKIPASIETKLIGVANTFANTLETKIKGSTLPATIIESYDKSLTALNKVITDQTNKINNLVKRAEIRIKDLSEKGKDIKYNNNGITEDKDNDPNTPDDFILPSGSNTMITADFGGMIKKIVPNNNDTLLGMPKESMDSLFKYANFGGEMNTMVPKEKSFDKNIQTLSQYVEQKIVTENTSNVKLGVEPISVNVKIEGTGLNKDDINKLVNQDDINTAVIEKLRSIFDETKLINAIPQL
jgi:hypothetical protein